MPTVIHSLWIRGPVPDQGPDGADQGPDGGFGFATTTGAATAPARPT